MSQRMQGNILVVDDTPANLRILVDLLSKQGYTVRPAPSGPLALKAVQASPPDLILLDIMMPEMDGYTVCERLKGDERTREIPVIFLSALDETLNKVRAFSLGAVDYITKPFEAEEVFARIKTHLMLYHLQRQQRELFQRFATKEVVDELMHSGFSLGGQVVQVSVLFADIRSFTTYSETQPPEEIIAFLNEYFAQMLDVVGQQGGIVNQLVGDGIMAIFGAPVPHEDHRMRAVRAALAMQGRVAQLNEGMAARGREPIRVGVGIASGAAVAGFVGTESRATYTCVGDTVNTASRLESHTKEAGCPIIIDEQTRTGLHHEIPTIDRGLVQLRGKMQPVRVFSVEQDP